MSAVTPDRLYELLPALYRERDTVEGQLALRRLLRLVEEQVELVEGDIGGLWDDLFIETCDPWVIPYIGDLVGNETLRDASAGDDAATAESLFTDLVGPNLRPPVAVRTRADVANTIAYRRRKGTLAMLEGLARDVTGWPAHAVEFFQLLGWTQHVEHLRPACWTDLRSLDRLELVDGPFDETSHTVDVRPLAQGEGWHSIPNVGFFLWRLGSYALENVPARVANVPWRFHCSPLGNPAPLFTRWRREPTGSLATELDVAAPIRRTLFYEDLAAWRATPTPRTDYTELYGAFDAEQGGPISSGVSSLFVVVGGHPVVPADVVCRRLFPWPAAQRSGREVSVDVVNGRIALGDAWTSGAPGVAPPVDVFFHYGFGSALGGGPYERGKWLVRKAPDQLRLSVREGAVADPAAGLYPGVTDALTRWVNDGRPATVVTILDSRTYALPASIALPNEGRLVLEAANGERPLLRSATPGLRVDVDAPADAGDPRRDAALTFSGVVLEGFVHVVGDLGRLRLLHSTAVPGRRLTGGGLPAGTGASIRVRGWRGGEPINAELSVEVAFSIAGPIVLPPHAHGLTLLDSIVDGVGVKAIHGYGGLPGPPLAVERSTIVGTVHVAELNASETVFAGAVDTVRTQDGCVRFSYVPPGSRTPRRYHCQPDLAASQAVAAAVAADPGVDRDAVRLAVQSRVVPAFESTLYGQPSYLQLRLACPGEIARGGDDGSELGVFNHVKQYQRTANLELRLREYLPFGLVAGTIFVT